MSLGFLEKMSVNVARKFVSESSIAIVGVVAIF
jgi:hypothetical protein